MVSHAFFRIALCTGVFTFLASWQSSAATTSTTAAASIAPPREQRQHKPLFYTTEDKVREAQQERGSCFQNGNVLVGSVDHPILVERQSDFACKWNMPDWTK